MADPVSCLGDLSEKFFRPPGVTIKNHFFIFFFIITDEQTITITYIHNIYTNIHFIQNMLVKTDNKNVLVHST